MIDVLEVFDGVRNVEFVELEATTDLPVFTIKEPTVEGWNAKAELINTKSFIRMTGKLPANYSVVREWVSSLISDTEKAPAVTGANPVHAYA